MLISSITTDELSMHFLPLFSCLLVLNPGVQTANQGSWVWHIHSLFLSTTGGMGWEATTFYKHLVDTIAQKRQHSYRVAMGWLRCRLSFASLQASIMCIWSSRSSFQTLPWQHPRDGSLPLNSLKNSIKFWFLVFHGISRFTLYEIH